MDTGEARRPVMIKTKRKTKKEKKEKNLKISQKSPNQRLTMLILLLE